MTGLGVLALLTLAVLVVTQQAGVEPLTRMRYPAESAGRMVERHFAFYENYASSPAWERLLHRLLFGPRDRVRAEGIAVYREVLQHLQRHGDEATSWALFNTQARLLIALAETGRWPEFDAELARLGDHPERIAVGEALRYAYGHGPLVTAEEAMAGARLVPRGWAADRLNLRIATRVRDAEQARYWAQRLRSQAHDLRYRTLLLSIGIGLPVVAGLVLLGRRRSGVRRPASWNTSALDQPWSVAEGLAVGSRAALLALGVFVALHVFSGPYFRPGILTLWTTLFASLPMLWLMQRHLLRPRGLSLSQAFGLTITDVGAGRFLRIVLVILAVEWAGSLLIAWCGWRLGLEGHWSQDMPDRLIFGPWETTFLSAVDAVLWGPLFEEIGFRGLVYSSLRARLYPVPAALLSAALFSALHLYSLTGFLAVFWSGLVFALAFERYRSLLPVMVVHGIGNILSLSTVLLFYR